jgi:hypothetical protein
VHLSEGGSAARQRGSWLRLQLETTAPLRTIVVSPNRFNSALTIVSSVDQTHFGRERQGRGTGSGRWAPCRGGRRGRDGPTAAALAASLSAGSAACAMQRSVIHTASSARNCSRHRSTDVAPPCHIMSFGGCSTRPFLSGSARTGTTVQTQKHTNTETQKHTNNSPLVPAPICSFVRCRHKWRSCLQRTHECFSPRTQAPSDTLTLA